jgi:hypothetical protein
VSADVGADNGARGKTTPTKRQRAKSSVKKTRPSASHCEAPAEPLLECAQPMDAAPAVETTAVPTAEATIVPTVEATAVPTMAAASIPMTISPAERVVPVTPRAPQPLRAPARRTSHLRAIALTGAALLVIAALAFPRHPSAPGIEDEGDADAQAEPQKLAADLVGPSPYQVALSAAPVAAPVAPSAAVAPRPVSAPSKKLAPKLEKNRIAESTTPGAPIAAATPVADILVKEHGAMKLPGSEASAPPALASASTGTSGTAPVTITGCLEISVDQDEFRLTETDGVDAPRSRSWRTGFLKKRAAPVALVEPPERLALQTHVGRRVAATGLLTSHDLRVSALRVVGPTCN